VEGPEDNQESRQQPAGVPAELLDSFLDEARQAVAGIAAALAEGATGGEGGAAAGAGLAGVEAGVDLAGGPRRQLKLLTHRLRGSAALFGFERMSRLAGAMEDLVDLAELEQVGGGLGGAPAAGPAAAGSFLAEAAAALARALDDIAAGGDDRAAAAPVERGDPAAAPPAATPAAGSMDGVAAELRLFATADPEVLEYFGPEAEEHIETMASALAAIRQRGPDAELVTLLFRAVHTLKGAAYTVGCGPIARLAHGMEDLLAALRARDAGWSGAAQPALAEAVEALRLLLAATTAAAGDRRLEAQAPHPLAEVSRSLSEIAEGALLALAAALAAIEAHVPLEAMEAIETLGTPAPHGPEASGEPGMPGGAPALPVMPGGALAGPAMPGGAPAVPGWRGAGVSAMSGFRSSIRVSIERIDRLMSLVGELVIARGRLDRRLERLAELEELALSKGARMSQAVEEFGARHLYPQLQAAAGLDPGAQGAGTGVPETAAGGPLAFRPPAHGSAARTGAAASGGGGEAGGGGGAIATAGATWATTTAELFAELEFDRYDDFNLLARRTGEAAADLDELHGEIARLTTLLRDDASQLQRLVRDLRGGIGRARMVPIGQLFARFRRLVTAAAAAAGKRVTLDLEGEAVEVDAAVAEAIADPLMHLVQNAVIHGIEAPEPRRSRGKPEEGLLLLRAYLQGRFVTVEVEDDGGGIDVEALRRQAVALGLRTATAAAALTREQAIELAFLPGLSTSPAVTQEAGRGIGMDVVRTNVTRLGGEIAIETEAGTGTRFTLKAPLTLLISEALLVRVGAETFAIPVTAVRRMLHAGDADLATAAGGGEELLVRGGAGRLPLLRLDRLFGLAGRRTEPLLPVVVLAAGGRACALAVDELLGVEEVVIKGLGELLAELPLFSGAIVTAEGRVVLLLDAPAFTLDPAALAAAAGAAATAAEAAGTAGEAWRRTAPDPAAAGSPDAPPAGAAGALGSARELLLVDDSVSVRKAVGQMLGRHGYRVTAVADGEEALEALRQGPFDAVLTDLEMPRLNGYELIEEIRRSPGGRELPIVVITTRAGSKHLDLARQLGATACFGKPFDAAALLSLLGGLGANPLRSSQPANPRAPGGQPATASPRPRPPDGGGGSPAASSPGHPAGAGGP
jgi:chemosensory pili system protein ChpA (sensor histidine kinase/response regulator)